MNARHVVRENTPRHPSLAHVPPKRSMIRSSVSRRARRQPRGRDSRAGRDAVSAPSTPDLREDQPLGPALEFLQYLWRLNHALELVSSSMVRMLGVTAQQRFVIRCVGKFPGMTVGQLARVLHLDPGTVSTTLNRLEQQRLLIRRRDPRDRRRVHLRLTARGRVVDHRSSGTVEHAVERLFRTSSSSSIVRARAVISGLIDLLHAEAEAE